MTITAPQIEDVPAAKLSVDPTVQRTVDKLRVDKIAADYHAEAIGMVVVSRREDGTLHVIDGQHRVLATIAAGYGDQTLGCLVYEGLTRADEAAMFRRLNNARAVIPVDKFRIRVIEGEPSSVILNDILTRYGWTVRSSKTGASFSAVAAFERVYRGKPSYGQDSAAVCDTVLRVLTEAWGHDTNGVRAEAISGVGAVLLRHGDRVDLPKLISQLAQHESGPLGLIGRARGLHSYRGGTLGDAFAEVVVELINKGRRGSSRLPDWRLSD